MLKIQYFNFIIFSLSQRVWNIVSIREIHNKVFLIQKWLHSIFKDKNEEELEQRLRNQDG